MKLGEISKRKTNVPDFNVFRARKCPECGSKNYERSRSVAMITRHKDGETTKEVFWSDAGHFRCLDCGFSATP